MAQVAHTTMGELADWNPPPDEEIFFSNILRLLDEIYPKDWRSWVVNHVDFEDIFGGENISSDAECRLRFAIPTTRLAKAYKNDFSLSERRYKQIKRILITWPLGRALIYAPLTVMAKIHPVNAYNKFSDVINEIKSHLIPRSEASERLKSELAEMSEIASTSNCSRPSKRTHSPEAPKASKEPKLGDFMLHQNIMMEKLCQMMQMTNENINAMIDRDHTSRPLRRSYSAEPEESYSNSEDENWEAPPMINAPVSEDEVEEELADFTPGTKETEAKVTRADETMIKQGIQCQRFNSEGWQNIRYADVQKQFQAAPAFTNLKVNSNLATVTPQWQLVTVLEKMDLCLGAITHGLLQQRQAFTDIYQKATPETKTYISKNFLSADSTFKKTSDCLLQYACGKRAEVIQQRRGIYKPVNKTLNELLHAIPPSENHLFAEPQLSELVKEQGGVSKLFPTKFRKTPATTAPQTTRMLIRRAPAATTSETRDRSQASYQPNQYRNVAGRRPERSRFPTKQFRTATKQNKNQKKF